jgi:hypothetical protein
VSVAIILLATFLFIFLYMISSNLRGPLKNEYLSDNELNFVDSLKVKCNCDVTIEKDYKVETANEDSGAVYLELNYNKSDANFCFGDSISLLEKSKEIFHSYKNIMTKRDAYSMIAINYYSSDFGNRSETPTCDRTFYFDIVTNNYTEYDETNRDIRVKKQSRQSQ